jgi:hypothetical protein
MHCAKKYAAAPLVCGLLAIVTLLWLGASSSRAADGPHPATSFFDALLADMTWGGYLKLRGQASWPDDESLLGQGEDTPFYDGNFEGRLTNHAPLGTRAYFDTHYEIVLTGGDTRQRESALELPLAALRNRNFLATAPPTDDARLFDLTRVIDSNNERALYHRLDRLVLTALPDWGSIRIGRQAYTLGYGLIFNPMDLLNPFAPTDIEREYKIGDDLVLVQWQAWEDGDLQFIHVARRDPRTHHRRTSRSSTAAVLQTSVGTQDFTLLATRHFDDYVLGAGTIGYIADAAWRLDATYTFLENGDRRDGYLSLVANTDYSWVWRQTNFYGLVEYFHSGIGNDDPIQAIADEDLTARLARGELFNLGRHYLAQEIRIELHPLVNLFATNITNLEDPSGFIQPRVVWEVTEAWRLTVGSICYYGGNDTEYGGFQPAGAPFKIQPADAVYAWLAFYF